MSNKIRNVNKIFYVINLLSIIGGVVFFAYIAIF